MTMLSLSEETHLLPKTAVPTTVPDEEILGDLLDEYFTPTRKLVAHEFWILIRGSIPVILAYILQNSLQTVSLLVVGRISPQDLSTAAFSYMFASSTGWLIGIGGTTALDTLASSTFTGSKDKDDLGVLLQRAFLVLTLLYVPVALLWTWSESVFLALGQSPQLSRDSAQFLTCLIPGGLGYIYFEIMKKFLQSQGIMRPASYVLLVTSPLSAVLNYLFVHVAGWGLYAAPFAVGIGYWSSFVGLVLYCKFVTGSKHWGGWSRRCLQNMWIFAQLAVMGIIQMGTEWWSFEIIALAAGLLGKTSLAAQSVILTADLVISVIPFGIGVTTSARLGNVLGTRSPKGAARTAYTAIALGAGTGAIVLTVLTCARNAFAKIFNDDEDVVKLVSTIMPLVALFQIADGLHAASGGILRGTGRQHVGAFVNLIGYYGGGLPLGLYRAFHGWGLVGIWIGQCMAMYSVGFIELAVVAFTNWNKEVEHAFDRMDKML